MRCLLFNPGKQRCQLGHLCPDVEPRLDLPAPRRPHRRTQLRVGQQPVQPHRQRVHIARRHDETADAVLNQFRHAGHLRRDHGDAAGKRLHQHHGQAFGKAGQDQHVGTVQQGGHAILVQRTGEADSTGQAKALHLRLQCRARRAVARDGQPGGGVAWSGGGKGIQQQWHALDGIQTADKADMARKGRTRGGAIARRRHPAVHDLQFGPMGLVRKQHRLAAAEMADAGDEGGAGHLGVQPPPVHFEKYRGPVQGDGKRNARHLAGDHGQRSAGIAEMVVHMHHPPRQQMIGQHPGLQKIGDLPDQGLQPRGPGGPGQPQGPEPASAAPPQHPAMGGQQGQRMARRGQDGKGLRRLGLLFGADHGCCGGAADGAGQNLNPKCPQPHDLALDEGVGHLGIFARHIGHRAGPVGRSVGHAVFSLIAHGSSPPRRGAA